MTNDPGSDSAEDQQVSQSPPVPGRSCGTCMLCCKVMSIIALKKPSDVMCSHAVPGKGCTIREQRPLCCRQFFCGWRLDPNIDALWKPDISGFVLTISLRYGAMLVMVDPTRPLAWKV